MPWQQPSRPAGSERHRHALRPRDPQERKSGHGNNNRSPDGGSVKACRHAASHQGDLHRLGRQSRRVVRLLRQCCLRSLLCEFLLSTRECGSAAAQCRHPVCTRLHRAPHWWVVLRPPRRPLWSTQRTMLSVVLMCFGSLMIAVTPTYASIGIGAPALLGLARIIQGLSLGGERYLSHRSGGREAPRLL